MCFVASCVFNAAHRIPTYKISSSLNHLTFNSESAIACWSALGAQNRAFITIKIVSYMHTAAMQREQIKMVVNKSVGGLRRNNNNKLE